MMSERPARVLCVDDNRWIGESIERILRAHPDLAWAGWLPSTEGLVEATSSHRADVVLLDIDIPGEDSFGALEALGETCPDIKVIVLSGHVRAEYVDRALIGGAWGYISKNEDSGMIVAAIRQAIAGETALSPVVAAELARH
jgi:two-component system NarL family response regulator